MATGVVTWSTTAASNASADSNVNWAEGMAPSAVNDSARAMMASVAKFRDDTNGSIATGGTSTAYTVTSNQSFASLSAMDNAVIAFIPHTTSGAAPTLAVDGLTAKKIRMVTAVDLPDGVLVSGTPYVVTYEAGVGEFLLHNFAGNPWLIPLGVAMPFFGSTSPNSSLVLPYGQAISRTTYSTLFTMFSTTYGSGDGSTTFNIPDLRGRLPIGKDDMGGGGGVSRVTTAGSGIDGATLGATGGAENITLTTAGSPDMTTDSKSVDVVQGVSPFSYAGGGNVANAANSAAALNVGGQTINNGGGSHFNMPPGIVCNYLIRII